MKALTKPGYTPPVTATAPKRRAKAGAGFARLLWEAAAHARLLPPSDAVRALRSLLDAVLGRPCGQSDAELLAIVNGAKLRALRPIGWERSAADGRLLEQRRVLEDFSSKAAPGEATGAELCELANPVTTEELRAARESARLVCAGGGDPQFTSPAQFVSRDVLDRGLEAVGGWLRVLEHFTVLAAFEATDKNQKQALLAVANSVGLVRRAATNAEERAELQRATSTIIKAKQARLQLENRHAATHQSFGAWLEWKASVCIKAFPNGRPDHPQALAAYFDSFVDMMVGALFDPAAAAAGVEIKRPRAEIESAFRVALTEANLERRSRDAKTDPAAVAIQVLIAAGETARNAKAIVKAGEYVQRSREKRSRAQNSAAANKNESAS